MTLHNCEFSTLKDMANKIGVQWQAGEYMLVRWVNAFLSVLVCIYVSVGARVCVHACI